MFEAHLHISGSSPHIPAFIATLTTRSEQFSNIVFNQQHRCHTWAWTAKGKRKDETGAAQETLFLYIEYRNKQNATVYLKREISAASQADEQYLLLLCQSIHLPDICAENTTTWAQSHELRIP
ncbi:hypothetical protein [Neptunomonas sp. XY-337]|uniref:hypothetical protein n=1 Tax=Neptunomonas sp. XY-337 TaxID=2561897 RepID=UPI0010AA23DB|nr:hypothetical protein [Neptunomonas sp. XY-337]